MQKDDTIKQQRDRFLSFSFATSDLLLEVSDEGEVVYALGAVKGLTGNKDANALCGMQWLDLFLAKDRMTLKLMLKKAKPGLRCGPMLVSFTKAKVRQNILVSAIQMPDQDTTFICIAAANELMSQIAGLKTEQEQTRVLDKESFIDAAQETLRMAAELGQDVDLTLIDLPDISRTKKRFGEEAWDSVSQALDELLCAESIDGEAATKLAEGRFGILHDADIDIDALKNKITTISKEHDPFEEGLSVVSKTISTDMNNMDERDASRALFYTLNEFERKGTEMTIEALNSNFKTHVVANTQKIQQFKSILDNLDFSMHFQPIVQLDNHECTHYEMLCRFREGNTFEWVMFAEDIGMAPDFDIAVCTRSLKYISEKRSQTKERFSINISGQSIANHHFLLKLMGLIKVHEHLKDRIIFEITESTQITELDAVGNVVRDLQAKGFQVALDDFGAGAASFQYLNSMHVDYVKIDGKYIKNILNDKRDMIMVKNLTQMCKDLEIKVVGEFVENKEISDTLTELGIDYGQGYYFGKPEASPNYQKIK